MSASSFVLTHIGEAVTLSPLVESARFTHIQDGDLGRIMNAWIAVSSGKIAGVGFGSVDSKFEGWTKIDAEGALVLPGLVDAHTHPIFAGSRANEFCMRLAGKTYQEIAAAGGGILSTVGATKQASDAELEALFESRAKLFLSHGVTTFEAKSGYGLTVEEELRHLRILRRVSARLPSTVYVTCLALHAVPKGEASAALWSKRCADELLPKVAKENLADGVDAFIEAGYFSVADCEPFLKTAQDHGLAIRIHADEFSDAGAAACAADYQAKSADHLQFANSNGIQKMAKSQTVALILPGTSVYTGIPYTDARPFVKAGCAVGLATDFNPGSCVVDNLRFIVTLGALHCKLSPWEAIAAVTRVPAKALGLEASKGAIYIGMDADLLLLPLKSAEEFVADLGRAKPLGVYAKGLRVH